MSVYFDTCDQHTPIYGCIPFKCTTFYEKLLLEAQTTSGYCSQFSAYLTRITPRLHYKD
jgi:hypothetical protein